MKFIIPFMVVKRRDLVFLIPIILMAAFFRFYQIDQLQFFTYDQARDDLIVKRILVDHKFTLLGPQSSMKGAYLPPFYYYTLAPVLWLSGLNPIGVDIYTAIIGVMTVILIWYVVREFFNLFAAILVSALYASSPLIVELSRRAWNPNTQPFFVLLMILFLYRLFQRRQAIFLFWASLTFGYAINLHYGAVALLPVWLAGIIWTLFYLRKFREGLLAAAAVFVFIAPLILFDLRHNGMLITNIYQYFFAGERINFSPNNFLEPMVASIFQIFVAIFSGNFLKTGQVPFEFWGKINSVLNFSPVSIIAHKPLLVQYQWWGIFLLAMVALAVFWLYVKREKRVVLNLLLGTVFAGALVSRFYTGKFYFFYYIFLFPLPFLFLGSLFWFLGKDRWGLIGAIALFLGIFYFNIKNVLVFEPPERTIEDIRNVSQIIAQDAPEDKPFNIAANYRSADRWDHNAVDYRYFTEAYYHAKPLDWQPEDYRQAEILYVVAEGGLPDPLGTKIMEIEEFAPKKIGKIWELPKGVVIYRLEK